MKHDEAMPRYIDADALLADIERTTGQSGCVNHESEIMDCIEYAPTIDAVQVVRCKECEHYNTAGFPALNPGTGWCERMDRGTNDDFYCSLAERGEGWDCWGDELCDQ